jgi:hypothetical protein
MFLPKSFSVSYVSNFGIDILLSPIGTDAMASKLKKRDNVKKKLIKRNHCSEKTCQGNARRSITT